MWSNQAATLTVTSFVATTIVTITQTLTFVDPSRPTRTQTVTFEAAPKHEPIASAVTTATGGAVGSATETTTVTVIKATRTRFHTVFKTVNVGSGVTTTTVTVSVAGPTTSAPAQSQTGILSPPPPPLSTSSPGPISSVPATPPESTIPAPAVSSTTGSSTPGTPSTTTTSTEVPPSVPQSTAPTSVPTAISASATTTLQGGQIAGIVVGIFAFLVLLLGTALAAQRRRRRQLGRWARARGPLSPDGGLAPWNSPTTTASTLGGAGRVRVVIRPPPLSPLLLPGREPWPITPTTGRSASPLSRRSSAVASSAVMGAISPTWSLEVATTAGNGSSGGSGWGGGGGYGGVGTSVAPPLQRQKEYGKGLRSWEYGRAM